MSRSRFRSGVVAVLIVLSGIVLLSRMFSIQVLAHEEWFVRREANPRQLEWLTAHRGEVEDRWGRVLARDESHFSLQLLYRGFRRGHALGLLVHLDHFVRSLAANVESAPAPIVRGSALAYGDTRERLHAALDGVLRMPATWLHRRGPLAKQLRGVLRFYVFSCLDAAQREAARRGVARLGLAFDRRYSETPNVGVLDAVAALISKQRPDAARADARDRVHAWLDRGCDELDTLEGILGDRLVLPGRFRETKDGRLFERGPLRAWLDALDGVLEQRTARRFEEAKQAAAKRSASGFWERIKESFLSRRHEVVAEPGFLERLDLRFRLDNAQFAITANVSFDSVVALVVGKRERYPGFSVAERVRRVYPRQPSEDTPYRLLGTVREQRDDTLDRPQRLLPVGSSLDASIDGRNSVHLEEPDWLRWRHRIIAKLKDSGWYTRRRGVHGVEAALDDVLTGQRGLRELLRDRRGTERQSPRHVAARPGHDVRLTIDADLQDLALEALREGADVIEEELTKRGKASTGIAPCSIAVLDARKGDIYALAWLPERQRYESGDEVPFRLNTAVWHWYQPYPGSVVKPVVACEGLVRGTETSDFVACYRRYPRGARHSVGCDCRGGGRALGLEEAIQYSCNTWFAQLGQKLGQDGISDALARFGLLRPGSDLAPLGLRVSKPVRSPREDWKPIHRAIGYGLWTSPLLVARAYAGIGTGVLPQLRYVDRIENLVLPRQPGRDLGLGAGVLRRVRRGLGLVTGRLGTARRAGLAKFLVAGKTGTAEVRNKRKNNLWFAGYLPAQAPRLAIACVYWDAPLKMHGGDVAAVAVARFLAKMRATSLWSEYVGEGAR